MRGCRCLHDKRSGPSRPWPLSHLIDPIAEAQREDWLGGVEGLEISLVGAEGKLAQLDTEQAHRATVVDLGIPTFPQIATRTSGAQKPAR
ncbi:hypothetical protein [Streptomyces sp. NPDC058572]|uniref:hypothetical protein n=1 Tax=Streptomyces sp. NPDC058572 TaxID=3346546 RepID=UPI003648952A